MIFFLLKNKAKDEELANALEVALEVGYRYFDTSLFYENQHVIGNTISKWISLGRIKREDVIISSTFSIMGTENVESFLEIILQNLQIDYLDFFLIQFPVGVKFDPECFKTFQFNIDEDSDITAIWKKMEELVKKGRVRGIGMCSFTQRQVERILDVAEIKPSLMQLEIHPFLQQEEMVKFCQSNGITVVAFCPLGSPCYNNFMDVLGAPKYIKILKFTLVLLRILFFRKTLPRILSDDTIRQIAKKHNKTTAQVILKFALERDLIVIPKSTNPQRIKENFDLFNFELDAEDILKLRALDRGSSARIVDYAVFPR